MSLLFLSCIRSYIQVSFDVDLYLNWLMWFFLWLNWWVVMIGPIRVDSYCSYNVLDRHRHLACLHSSPVLNLAFLVSVRRKESFHEFFSLSDANSSFESLRFCFRLWWNRSVQLYHPNHSTATHNVTHDSTMHTLACTILFGPRY